MSLGTLVKAPLFICPACFPRMLLSVYIINVTMLYHLQGFFRGGGAPRFRSWALFFMRCFLVFFWSLGSWMRLKRWKLLGYNSKWLTGPHGSPERFHPIAAQTRKTRSFEQKRCGKRSPGNGVLGVATQTFFIFTPSPWGNDSNLTNILQMSWNHQLVFR